MHSPDDGQGASRWPNRRPAPPARRRDGRSGGGRAAADRPVLHPPRDVRRTCARCTAHGGREGDVFYRDRWSHDKVVRSTHGVNCTGSCSWKVYVKDGIITWESQQTDYPSVGPDSPGVRAARLPARRGLLLVHLLPHPGPLPVRPRRAGGDVPRGEGPARRPGAGLGRRRRRPGEAPPLPAGPRQGRARAGLVGRGGRDRRRRARPHDQGATGRTGSPASPRSRRCRWSATPSGRGSSSSSAAA